MTETKKPAKRTDAATDVWTAEEKAAMKSRAKELRADKDRAAGEEAVLAALAAMPEPDRAIGERIHAIVTAGAPDLAPKTWYGMPAYAKDGNVICFFQPADKFKARYATFGFNDHAHLDDGEMWATSWALVKLTSADEAKIAALVKRAVS
jgi:uncharacterized protein YdhG (YjbR/CyaY superfamily)